MNLLLVPCFPVPVWVSRLLFPCSPFPDSPEVARSSRARKNWSKRAEGGLGIGVKKGKGKERDCALSCNRLVQGNSAHNSLNPLKIQLTE